MPFFRHVKVWHSAIENQDGCSLWLGLLAADTSVEVQAPQEGREDTGMARRLCRQAEVQ